MVLPLTHSVASDDDAIAEPQPKVLNLASSMTLVCGLTLICNFMTSPHSGAPTGRCDIGVLLSMSRRCADCCSGRLLYRCMTSFTPSGFKVSMFQGFNDYPTESSKLQIGSRHLETLKPETLNLTSNALLLPTSHSLSHALFRHFVERREFAQAQNGFDDAVAHIIDSASVLKRPMPKRSSCAPDRRRAESFQNIGWLQRLRRCRPIRLDTAISLMPISSDSPSTRQS